MLICLSVQLVVIFSSLECLCGFQKSDISRVLKYFVKLSSHIYDNVKMEG